MSPSRVAPQRAAEERRSTSLATARHRAAGIPDLIQTDLLPQSRLDQRSEGHHRSPYVYEYYEVLSLVALSHCPGVVALMSWLRDLHDLEVGYVGFIINACARA
jgi:hypothetical protein